MSDPVFPHQSNAPGWSERDLRALLAWYAAMGVDAALSEGSVDRFAEPPAPRRAVSQAPSSEIVVAGPPPNGSPAASPAAEPMRPTPNLSAASVGEAERLAREIAQSASTLDELREALARFEGCNLRYTATKLVFADGTPGSQIMLVGEAPGRDEDLQGVPFVGRAGQLLEQMLKAIGLRRDEVYIANIVPWRPPGNRTPTPQETAACRPFVMRQIELANPEILVCLGNAAMHELLATGDGILKMRGRWRTYDTGSRTIPAIAMLHPAYLLRQPLHKRLAWRDLLTLKAALDAPLSS